MTSDLGVVTVTYESADAIGAFLDSVRRDQVGREATVIVADNASTDAARTSALVADRGARWLPLASNVGYGTAINAGVAELPESVRFVLISNPDVLLEDNALSTLRSVAESRPRAASIGPRILDADGETYPSARSLPSLRTGIGHALLFRVWRDNPWTQRYRMDRLDPAKQRTTGWLSGACLLVRREAFDQVSGFDPGYFMYFEDVDLGDRFRSAGWENVYAPSAQVVHSGAHSTSRSHDAMLRSHHRSS